MDNKFNNDRMIYVFPDLSRASDIMSGMRDVAPMVSRVQLTTDHLCAHWSEGLVRETSAQSFGRSNASNCPINFLIIPILPTLIVIIN